jgi:hypothetical protein
MPVGAPWAPAWQFDDVTTTSGAPPAQQGSALTSWVSSTDNKQHIAYIGPNGDVYELYMSVGVQPWRWDNVTTTSGAPPAQQGSGLTSWISTTDDKQHIAYIGKNGHVYELYMPVGVQPWHWDDATANQPLSYPPRDGGLTSWISNAVQPAYQQIAYIGTDSNVYLLLMPAGQPPWRWYQWPSGYFG